ncbi:proton channel OtopLc-like [Pieris napi]|uniref:proton channel OtopLc-like n=1 Tax=Pieris napi TaxID=78633 RepID=UPI001FBB7603|nr:proton channel OtopLc-like [Pieris napi]
MGTIVSDLYHFIIEYSVIGAFINVMFIVRFFGVADAITAAQRDIRVVRADASEGHISSDLEFPLEFFIYLFYFPDLVHCALMVLSVLVILLGFKRVKWLEFRRVEEHSDLTLFRLSALGLLTYAVSSVIAAGMGAFTDKSNFLVIINGCLSVLQVILQQLFIADVSRRRIHLPEVEGSKLVLEVVSFLLISNIAMWLIYALEDQKVFDNPVQLDFNGFVAWSCVQGFTLPFRIYHRFQSAVNLIDIWKNSF